MLQHANGHFWSWKLGPGFVLLAEVCPCIQSWSSFSCHWWCCIQGILKGEASLYQWPPVWLVWTVLQIKTKIVNCQYSWFQTSQTGGQQYSDTSPFSIPCCIIGPVYNRFRRACMWTYRKCFYTAEWPILNLFPMANVIKLFYGRK
jgi:hypothetical protein